MHSHKRRRAEAWGRRSEAFCVLALRAKGYRVLARRFRCAVGEIDIVARRRGVLAMVEVKARPTAAAAIEAMTPRQRARVERAALAFLAGGGAGFVPQSDFSLRFDLMLVTRWRWPRHVVNAWQPELGAPGHGVW